MRSRLPVIGFLAIFFVVQLTGSGQRPDRNNPAQADARFTSGHTALRIPFEEDDGHIFIRVSINGSAPMWFGLDTGAIRSVIDRDCAARLGLKSTGRQQVSGAGGGEEAGIINDVSIKLGGAELKQTIWSLPLQAMSMANGRETVGIIGYELFSRFVVEIDYERLFINLHEPKSYKYAGPGEIIPLTLQDGEIYVSGKVTVPGREPIEGQYVIDTGANGSLLLAKAFVDENKLLEAVPKTIQARGGGVGGEIQMAIGRVNSFQLGRFVFDKTVTGFIKSGEIAAAGKAGNIGGKLLRRFAVIFDYGRRHMILEPNKHFAEPDEVDMSGMALMCDPPAFDSIRIVRLRPDSPAAAAGLQVGDMLVAVDGQSAAALTLPVIRKMFRIDGKEYLLTIKRADKTLKIPLKLKRQI